MLSRRLLPSANLLAPTTSPYAATTVRAFTASHRTNRAPALADVTPQSSAQFDVRQKEFRAEVLRRKQQESQSASEAKQSPSTSASSSSPTSSASSTTSAIKPTSQGLGSLSTSTGQAQQNGDDKKKPGTLSSLIYGTEEGRQMDREIERSFSQVLARGKYVHSVVFHEVKPDKVDEYVELVGSWYPRVAENPENKVGDPHTSIASADSI